MRLISCVACGLALGVVGSACSASNGKTAGNNVVMTSDRLFEPASITIRTGSSVSFPNDSEEPHSVTAYEGRIPSGARYFSTGDFSNEEQARDNVTETLVRNGDTFEVTLNKPGVYEYFCIPHETQGMKGQIVVEG